MAADLGCSVEVVDEHRIEPLGARARRDDHAGRLAHGLDLFVLEEEVHQQEPVALLHQGQAFQVEGPRLLLMPLYHRDAAEKVVQAVKEAS